MIYLSDGPFESTFIWIIKRFQSIVLLEDQSVEQYSRERLFTKKILI